MTKTNRRLKKFWTSKSGGVLIYVAFGLPILVGAMALSIDLGRAFILNTELKDFSDAAALAGAAELDGRNGARAAAEQAARTGLDGTLVNIQAFATDGGGANMAIQDVVFLRNLPEDGTDFTVDDTATSDADARFIFVSVVNRNVRAGLSRALGMVSDFDTSAKSIAGYSSVVCRIPAMMMCNPLEDVNYFDDINCSLYGNNIGEGQGWAEFNECIRGKQILMKTAGGGAAYNPGEFGLLDPPVGNQGAKDIFNLIATAAPALCVGSNADLRTGQAMGPVVSAINTRFDLYSPPMAGNAKNKWEFRPALNVVKGYTGQGCNMDVPLNPITAQPYALWYPRDACFAAGNCHDDRFGFGNWQSTTFDHDLDPDTPPIPYIHPDGMTGAVEPYWAINHPDPADNESYKAPPTTVDVTTGLTPGVGIPWAELTRYQLYRYEIETDAGLNLGAGDYPAVPDMYDHDNAQEQGNPSCFNPNDTPAGFGDYSDPIYDDPTTEDDDGGLHTIDRRVLRLVVINCVEQGPLNGNEDDVTTIGTTEIFLTEPAQGAGNDKADIFGEFIRATPPGTDEGLKDIVQLYR